MSKNPYQSYVPRGLRVPLWPPTTLRRFFSDVRSGTSNRWQRPELKEQLQPDEVIYWTDIAATGILSHPRIRSSAFGSYFWDLAITNQRLFAVQLPIVAALERWETYSVPWADVTRSELRVYTLTNAITLKIEAPSFKKRFKMLYSAFNYAAVTEAVRKAIPAVEVRTGL